MAQFTLVWDNIKVVSNDNATGQQASYKKRSDVSWTTTGFTPSNTLDKSATTTDTPSGLSNNVVYQLKVETICSQNGPSINDNDIQEIINFVCIVPTLTKTSTQGTIVLNVTGTDIYKAVITLRKSSDNTIIASATTVNAVAGSITLSRSSLIPSTSYYWQVDLHAIVNDTDVSSSNSSYLGSLCSPYPFSTDAPPVCNPLTSVAVTSVGT